MIDIHQLASLMVRDLTIIAKRHHDLARDNRAMADTWRRVLDDTQPVVLKSNEQGKTVRSELLPQSSFLFVDPSGEVIS